MNIITASVPPQMVQDGGPYTGAFTVLNTSTKGMTPAPYIFRAKAILVIEGVTIWEDTFPVSCDAGGIVMVTFEFIPHVAGLGSFLAVLRDANDTITLSQDEIPVLVDPAWWVDPIRAELLVFESWAS